jgi:hypothetical protein
MASRAPVKVGFTPAFLAGEYGDGVRTAGRTPVQVRDPPAPGTPALSHVDLDNTPILLEIDPHKARVCFRGMVRRFLE